MSSNICTGVVMGQTVTEHGATGVQNLPQPFHSDVQKPAPQIPSSPDGDELDGHISHTAAPAVWLSGLCDCANDWGSTADICLCPLLMSTQMYNVVTADVHDFNWCMCAGVAGLSCIHGAAGAGAAIMFQVILRQRLRERYGIHDPERQCQELAGDWFLALCCTSCMQCQMHREMTARGEWPGRLLFAKPPVPHAEAPETVNMA